jgi:hypothetical protein
MARKTDEEVAKDLARHIDEANKIMRAAVKKRGLQVNVKLETDEFDNVSLRDVPHITAEILRPVTPKGEDENEQSDTK